MPFFTFLLSFCLPSLQSLLDEPNPNSPANSAAAQLYQENRREYEKRVLKCVEESWADADAATDTIGSASAMDVDGEGEAGDSAITSASTTSTTAAAAAP